MKGKLIVLSAASGAGKTTLKDRVMKFFPKMVYSISATTRSSRKGEVNGKHYFFKTKEEFQKMIKNGELAEHKEVHGNFYGTPRNFLDQSTTSGRHVILDMDVCGKIDFDKIYPEATGIFICPPNQKELEKRLRKRGTDSEEVILRRLKNSVDETAFAKSDGKYEYFLVNDDLDRATDELKEILSGIIGGSTG